VIPHYRSAHSESAKKWLLELKKKENVPVLVCLTHADQLYSEIAEKVILHDQMFPPKEEVEPKLKAEKRVCDLCVVHVLASTRCHQLC